MNPNIRSPKESQLPIARSTSQRFERSYVSEQRAETERPCAQVFTLHAGYVESPERAGFVTVESIVNKWKSDPRRAAAIERARIRLGKDAQGEGPQGLYHLRLRQGLSQQELAQKIGTSQSRMSLIETGKTVIGFDIYEKLVNTLNVTRDELSSAIAADLKKT